MQWRQVRYFCDYEVSDSGLVRSRERYIYRQMRDGSSRRKLIPERVLKPATAAGGYLFVDLRRNKASFNKRIHHLVAEAFIGDRPKGMVVHHIDGNKQNNNATNLEYLTHYHIRS